MPNHQDLFEQCGVGLAGQLLIVAPTELSELYPNLAFGEIGVWDESVCVYYELNQPDKKTDKWHVYKSGDTEFRRQTHWENEDIPVDVPAFTLSKPDSVVMGAKRVCFVFDIGKLVLPQGWRTHDRAEHARLTKEKKALALLEKPRDGKMRLQKKEASPTPEAEPLPTLAEPLPTLAKPVRDLTESEERQPQMRVGETPLKVLVAELNRRRRSDDSLHFSIDTQSNTLIVKKTETFS